MSPSANTRVEWARRLAHSIVSDGYADDAAVAPILNEATDRGSSFPGLLISRDVTSQEVVLGLLSQLTRLPVVDLDHDHPSDEALAATPFSLAREYGAVGYRLDGDKLTAAFGDPPDVDDVSALSVLVGYAVVPVLANPLAIERVLASIEPPPAPAPAPAQGNGSAPVHDDVAANGVAQESSTEPRMAACWPARIGRRRAASSAPRRSPAVRRERGRVRPPRDDGAAGVHPIERRHPSHRRLSRAQQRDDPGHGLRDPPPDTAGALRGRKGARHLPLHRRCGAVPAECVPAEGNRGGGFAGDPPRDPALRGAGHPRIDPVLHRYAARPGTCHRPHRVRKVHDLGVAGRHHQPHQAIAHRHGGGSHRVPPHPQAGDRQPARGRSGHDVVLRSSSPCSA